MNSVSDLVSLIRNSRQHNCVYHFTDLRNLESLRIYGILSKDEMRKREISPVAPGGNEWSWDADRRKGISDYISLCATRNHPMIHTAISDGRISQPKHLRISPRILLRSDVMFSDNIANRADATVVPLASAIKKIDYEVLYTRTDWTDPAINLRLQKAERYEFLVPKFIAASEIISVI